MRHRRRGEAARWRDDAHGVHARGGGGSWALRDCDTLRAMRNAVWMEDSHVCCLYLYSLQPSCWAVVL